LPTIAKEYKIKDYKKMIIKIQDARGLLSKLVNEIIIGSYYDIDRENILNTNFFRG